MKCITCGLPLSPKRTHCPRCGTPVKESNQAQKGARIAQEVPFSGSPASPVPPMGVQPPNYDIQQKNLSARNINRPFTPAPTSGVAWNSPRVGFTLAGICVFSGMLLLIFVFLMAQTLAPLPNTTTQSDSLTHTAPTTTSTTLPTDTPTPEAATPTGTDSTPTPTTGQYITQAQLASSANIDTAQVITPATSFRVQQRVYIVFTVHAPQNGFACLHWVWSNKHTTDYNFTIQPVGNAVAWSDAQVAGSATVTISWSADNSCSVTLPGQSLQFIVTN